MISTKVACRALPAAGLALALIDAGGLIAAVVRRPAASLSL